MKTEDKLVLLIERLHAKSQLDEIAWEETSDQDTFQVSFPYYVAEIGTEIVLGKSFVTFRLRDQVGRTIEHVSDVDLDESRPSTGIGLTMRELYKMARRRAYGVDSALDSVLGNLG